MKDLTTDEIVSLLDCKNYIQCKFCKKCKNYSPKDNFCEICKENNLVCTNEKHTYENEQKLFRQGICINHANKNIKCK